jgi:hypothetical protein
MGLRLRIWRGCQVDEDSPVQAVPVLPGEEPPRTATFGSRSGVIHTTNPMEERPYELGGVVIEIEHDADLRDLPPEQRALLSDRLLTFWRDPRQSLRRAEERATTPSFRSWLRLAADAKQVLEIYLPDEYIEPKALLSFDFGPARHPGGTFDWHVLIDCADAASCSTSPPALREVHDAIGGLWTQYGASGHLLSPVEVKPLSRNPGTSVLKGMGVDLGRLELDQQCAFFDCDGDLLCFGQDARAFWIGQEWGDPDAPPAMTVDQALDDLFHVLSSKKSFNSSVQARLER